jgi:hypothetical protein
MNKHDFVARTELNVGGEKWRGRNEIF